MANNELNLRELRGEHDAEFESALCKAFEEVAALAAVPLDKRTTVILYKIWQAARAAAPAHAEPSGALPELPFGTDNLARLMRNLEGTSYNEGSEALACRLSDCRTVIAELLADRASRGQQGKQAIEARGGALPAGLVYAIERAINKARTPGGQHTNGPTFASLEVSQLEFVLKHCILGQQGGGDAARHAKFQERMRLFQIGKCLEDEEIDDAQQTRIGAELIALSGVCTSCYGGGQDGDSPDANGDGGWVGLCMQCDGTGLAAIQAQVGSQS